MTTSSYTLRDISLGKIQDEIRTLLNTRNKNADTDYLICHSLDKTRAWLYSHPEYKLHTDEKRRLENDLIFYLAGVPLAQIKSKKEFFSLEFEVDADVLIPRPETEMLVEQALLYKNVDTPRIIDLGTGCGNIAIAIQANKRDWHITATDISEKSLKVARRNAESHGFKDITFINADWFYGINQRFDVIISNPPYISRGSSQLSPDVAKFEPESALYSLNEGLFDLQKIIHQAVDHITPGGWLILEHAYNQAPALNEMFDRSPFNILKQIRDLNDHPRVIVAVCE